MLLIEKGKPTRAFCSEGRHLYIPTPAEIESQENQRPVFICPPCRKRIRERSTLRPRLATAL